MRANFLENLRESTGGTRTPKIPPLPDCALKIHSGGIFLRGGLGQEAMI